MRSKNEGIMPKGWNEERRRKMRIPHNTPHTIDKSYHVVCSVAKLHAYVHVLNMENDDKRKKLDDI